VNILERKYYGLITVSIAENNRREVVKAPVNERVVNCELVPHVGRAQIVLVNGQQRNISDTMKK
jgi:hypothetical protein